MAQWAGQKEEHTAAYSILIKDADAVIMRWKTYEQMLTELCPAE